MKYFVAIVFSMFLAMSAVAERPVNVELPSFVKEQTGLYQVSVGDSVSVIPSTGFTIEVFKAGERVLLSGLTLETDFVFATIYNRRGEYFVLNGPVNERVASVDVYRVTTNADGSVVNTLVGLGTLTVDSNGEGIADVIDYSLFVNTDILATASRSNTLLNGKFRRISDVEIVQCVQVLPDEERGTVEPVLLPCRNTEY